MNDYFARQEIERLSLEVLSLSQRLDTVVSYLHILLRESDERTKPLRIPILQEIR